VSDFGFGNTFDPLADAIAGAAEAVDLRSFLIEAGVPDEDVDQAAASDTLELLALERIAEMDAPRYALDDVNAMSVVDTDRIRAYWRALGFPDPPPGEKVFSDADLEMLSDVVVFITDGSLEPEVALQMARVIGSSLERIASALVDTIETRRHVREAEDANGPLADEGGRLWASREATALAAGHTPAEIEFDAVRRGAELLPMMPKIMEFVWRRHLHDAARRRRLRAVRGEGHRVCVGFADLVGFTAQTLQLSEEELAEVVARFETIAYDVVSEHGGRVVKMIGDEVMFVADDVKDGAELALALSDSYRNDEAMSDVRVGLASGQVLEREGDVYGPVVNLASRIVAIAYPGAVVVSEDIHEALADAPDLAFKTIRQHYLKDIGRVHLWTMRRLGDEEAEPYQHARDRRSARREFMLARRARRLAASNDLPVEMEGEVIELLEDAGLLDAQLDDGHLLGDESTAEFEAITDVVLDAEIDEELQVELLSDIEIARRLAALEKEAQEKAEEADIEAETRLELIEEETRRKVERIEQDARRRIEETLNEAEARAARVNEEASRKVQRVADEAERKAGQAERDGRRVAKRKTAERKKAKNREAKARKGKAPE
jgi:adenylate cyclase